MIGEIVCGLLGEIGLLAGRKPGQPIEFRLEPG